MSFSTFRNVKISGIKTSLPEKFIDIDNELEFFDNSEKKLARAKKMIGYGRRYIADENTTVTDLAIDAAKKLLDELNIEASQIRMLLFVNQKPDYPEPNDASLAHGLLGLDYDCLALHINQGCTGYVYGLWLSHLFISSGTVDNCLLLAGDMCGRTTDQTNRKLAPVFGDSASATFLERCDNGRTATFELGCDGSKWDRIVHPVGGLRIPLDTSTAGLTFTDKAGNKWSPSQGIMRGTDVYKFSITVAPALIQKMLKAAAWQKDDVSLYAIHQANKQMVTDIVEDAEIPIDKAPSDIFTKYANHSTNSVATVICDQKDKRKLDKVVLCSFGIGLSWACAAVSMPDMYNGGFTNYLPPADKADKKQLIEYWKKQFEEEGK